MPEPGYFFRWNSQLLSVKYSNFFFEATLEVQEQVAKFTAIFIFIAK